MNRRKIVIKNSIIITASQIFLTAMNFLIRSIFLNKIGVEYLGLEGVIADVLSMLNLAELGFQSAIVFRLYKPAAEHDYERINQIISLLKKIYTVIGVIILICGLLVMPFLRIIIKDISVSWDDIYISYIIHLLATASTYFLAYKRAYLYVDQRQDILTTIDLVVNVIAYAAKVLAIIYAANYLIYVSVALLQSVFSNVIVLLVAGHKYPWMNIRGVSSDHTIRREIFTDTRDVFAGKIAGYVYSSTDNLIISGVIGTVTVGFLSNYKMVLSGIVLILSNMFLPLAPMAGNVIASESKDKALTFFKNYAFLSYVAVMVFLIPAFTLMNVFIDIWIGSRFQVEWITAALLFTDKYISLMHSQDASFVDGIGGFKAMKNIYSVAALVNLVLSLAFSFVFGVNGVLGATIIAQMIMWVGRNKVCFCSFFQSTHERKKYWKRQVSYFVNMIIVGAIEFSIVNYLWRAEGFGAFLIKGAFCVLLSISEVCLIYRCTSEYQYFKSIIRQVLGHVLPQNCRM